MPLLLAHSGGIGWDELVLVAVPVVVLGALQIVSRRKARAAEAAAAEAAAAEAAGGSGAPADDGRSGPDTVGDD